MLQLDSQNDTPPPPPGSTMTDRTKTTIVAIANGDTMEYLSEHHMDFAIGRREYNPNEPPTRRMSYHTYYDADRRQAYLCGWAYAAYRQVTS